MAKLKLGDRIYERGWCVHGESISNWIARNKLYSFKISCNVLPVEEWTDYLWVKEGVLQSDLITALYGD